MFSEDEAQIILDDAAVLKMGGADGLVFGALNTDGKIDLNLNKRFLEVSVH